MSHFEARVNKMFKHVIPRNDGKDAKLTLQPTFGALANNDNSVADYFNLNDLLGDEEQRVRAKVRDFMKENAIQEFVVPLWEKAEFPFELVEKIRPLGIIGAGIKGFGCPNLSHLSAAMILMETARVDVSISTFIMVHGLAMSTINLCGSEAQKEKFLPLMARLEKIGCFALTEPNRGSDASNLGTTAKRVSGGWILNGTKRWIGNGVFADVSIVYTRSLEDGKQIGFIVEKGMLGFTAFKIENKIALRIVQKYIPADIHDVFIPDENVLSGSSFASGAGLALHQSRILVSWQPVGAAMGIFDQTLAYVKKRRQFGTPLASFQLVQERLSRMLGTIQSMILMSWRTSQIYMFGKSTAGQASMVKAYNTLRAREVAALGRELLGGNGIVQDYHVARLFCDIEALYTYEGTYDINSLVIGREITGTSAIKAPSRSRK